MFDWKDRGFLKILAQFMNVWILTVLSQRCFHQWGGAKMMLRELHHWMKWGDSSGKCQKSCFVYKTDVYSYYASINHHILINQLHAIKWPASLLESVIAYCERTILRIGSSIHCKRGIPKGGALSPVLGALYLTPLDHAMERWEKRGDCFYARFQDDIILVSRKRHVLKRMKKEMLHILNDLRLSLRPEKTFMGRSHKGFDLLGYHITMEGLSPSHKTQKKALENAKRRYAQGGHKPLQEYLKRWRTWVQAGLPFKVQQVEKIIESIIANIRGNDDANSQSITHCPTRSVLYGHNNLRKGISTCKINFSGHQL